MAIEKEPRSFWKAAIIWFVLLCILHFGLYAVRQVVATDNIYTEGRLVIVAFMVAWAAIDLGSIAIQKWKK